MIPFIELSPVIWGIFGTCAALLSVVAVYILITVCILRMERRYLFEAIVLLGTVIYVIQEIKIVSVQATDGYSTGTLVGIMGSFPWIMVILILLAQAVCAGMLLMLIWHR